MSTKGSAAILNQAAKDLGLGWQETKAHWHDTKSLEFEHQYLEEFPNRVMRALTVIEQLDALLGKVRNDCE